MGCKICGDAFISAGDDVCPECRGDGGSIVVFTGFGALALSAESYEPPLDPGRSFLEVKLQFKSKDMAMLCSGPRIDTRDRHHYRVTIEMSKEPFGDGEQGDDHGHG